MCNYLNTKECTITKTTCPYIYYCRQSDSWKPTKFMPKECKVKQNIQIPKGNYKVLFARKNKLYIQVDNEIIILQNPFNETPVYVKLLKTKTGTWKIKI